MPTVRLDKATKIYKTEYRKLEAVSDVDLTIKQGEFVFIVGSSGAGKSTLLQLITGQARPDRGSVFLDEKDLSGLRKLTSGKIMRNFGYVAQEPQFMRRRKVLDNLTIVASVNAFRRGRVLREIAYKALGIVGLKDNVADKYPGELSIGEARRVELARAIINSPPILVLDEVTANIDEDSIWDIMHLLSEMNLQGTTVIMATHAKTFVNIMRRRVITLVNGKVIGDVEGGRYGQIVGKKKPF